MVPPPPPTTHRLPTMDFETYSEAGFIWSAADGKWTKVGPKGGIQDVGAWAYSRHPSTECLWLSYDMRDGLGVRNWMPWLPAPQELFDYVARGGLIEAHNSFFEYCIWNNVFTRQLGAPPLPVDQLRDSAAACAAHGLPRSMEDAGRVMGCAQQKDTKAAAQVKKLWMPRKPTKGDPSKRLTLEAQTELHLVNGGYCADDVRAEVALSDVVPPLSPYELEVWKLDQRINARGVGIDTEALNDAIAIVEQMRAKYVPMMPVLTNGEVKTPNSHAQLRDWCCRNGVELPDTQADTITEALERDDLPPHVRDVLEIRVMVGGAAINKVFAMQRFGDPTDGRVRGVFSYYGAVATGRFASRGVQLHNNPNSGPDHYKCGVCHEHYGTQASCCLHCGSETTGRADEWGNDAAESALRLFKRRDLELVEKVWGNALAIITACIRAFISAAPGHDLICADYSAIEARVIAQLAGEDWRLDVFRTHGKIYEASACQMFGMTLDDFATYKQEHGGHHPARKKGKVAELALGYGGGWKAMAAFGADKFMTEKDMKDTVRQWRAASPNVAALWYNLEECAVNAVRNPGAVYSYRLLSYQVRNNVLYCKLPSGRELTYHSPRTTPVYVTWEETGRLEEDGTPERVRCEYPYPVDGGRLSYKLTHMGTPKKGAAGSWVVCNLYSGVLAENVCQAVARDLLADALLRLDKAGYPVIMHVHDEIIAEVPHGFGSIEEFEAIMEQTPHWAAGWPIKADGGWRGLRYRK